MREADLGYRPDNTVVAAYSLPRKQYSTQPAVDQFNQELLRRLAALPARPASAVPRFSLPTESRATPRSPARLLPAKPAPSTWRRPF